MARMRPNESVAQLTHEGGYDRYQDRISSVKTSSRGAFAFLLFKISGF
jgi:hypothetical protein